MRATKTRNPSPQRVDRKRRQRRATRGARARPRSRRFHAWPATRAADERQRSIRRSPRRRSATEPTADVVSRPAGRDSGARGIAIMSPVDVLVVDDDREIVRAIDLRLRKSGFETTAAFDGQQGLEIAQHSRPDVILMDLRMPVMDGFTMLKRLQNSVLTANIPAIVLSADSADRARLQAMRGGATFFVEKPYRPEDLIGALNAAVKPSQPAAPTIEPPERIMPNRERDQSRTQSKGADRRRRSCRGQGALRALQEARP